MNNTVIIIFGPTGVGKSKTAIKLAKKLDGEIISCDSMQVFSQLNVGTAKVTDEEKQGIVHHLLDVVSPSEEFSVGQYVQLAREKIKDILQRGKQPIIVGGTGLYIKALINNYDFGNAQKDENIREKYKKILEEKGNEYLYNILLKKDENISKKIHCNDTKKVIRALEIIENNNKILEKNDFNEKINYNYLLFGLFLPREEMYEKINQRTIAMFKNGLIEEVKNLIKSGISEKAQSMQGIGYKEVVSGLKENFSEEEMIKLIQQKTRNYAKRQLTFMRGMENLIWVDAKNSVKEILEVINGNRN